MAILGALGLLSLAEDLLQWQDQFQTWIDAWQAFSRPIAMFLFGWLANLSPWELPDWWMDYIAMGIIVSASSARSITIFDIYDKYNNNLGIFPIFPNVAYASSVETNRNKINDNSSAWISYRNTHYLAQLIYAPYVIVTWPVQINIFVMLIPFSWHILKLRSHPDNNIGFQKRATIIFFNSFIWAAILIAINYAWIASG
jgi:hypothetical protein